eukprot:TRINITY_DN1714_c0_g3_i6.p4 TRINITY_DN1714_c0_g3~~TRINITY_DN1714_c0_g3_i6.p4  ORF type:complete len:119 (+),score=8.89 TRINITY_DN1714_c0_g3_i6:820-1176(+)
MGVQGIFKASNRLGVAFQGGEKCSQAKMFLLEPIVKKVQVYDKKSRFAGFFVFFFFLLLSLCGVQVFIIILFFAKVFVNFMNFQKRKNKLEMILEKDVAFGSRVIFYFYLFFGLYLQF